MSTEKKLNIRHKTVYTYDNNALLSPQKILLSPSLRRYFHILSYESQVFPQPQGENNRLDMEGNLFQQVWFSQPTNKLEIDIETNISTADFNPFEFIIDKTFELRNNVGEITFNYPPEKQPFLLPFLNNADKPEINEVAKEFKSKSQDTVSFLVDLTAYVHQLCKHIIREAPGIWAPEKTLNEAKGSCRDLAWLLINILRSEGLASRFVSGYAYNPKLEENHELHAWVEAFCPGAGWIGLDPSLGLLTDAFYIPLAASFLPELTLPVVGSFIGATSSKLESYVEIKEV
ncbi:transglutaminase family protein [Echinicola sp. CAU 1574]|uniref:Transglutaminase family protein n=1 Tax=Echinicola arenosa TaxID=2774144 RepID=A0ABR9AMA2_9BACT|nr:transglutaminase family protein [Echinicola arenosa]MBD8489926.1 transglutaminase family protein [Echinicola arenosa]